VNREYDQTNYLQILNYTGSWKLGEKKSLGFYSDAPESDEWMNSLDASRFLVELAKQIMHISSQKLSLLKLIQTVSIKYRDFLANNNLDDSDIARSAFRMD
jgi:hypothetical protein